MPVAVDREPSTSRRSGARDETAQCSDASDGTLFPMARRRDPDRNKRQTLDERVDAWGESQKAARKNLPKKRARTHRGYRRAVKVELQWGADADPKAIRRKPFEKWAGPNRAAHLARQKARRDSLENIPRRSEEARARRSVRRRCSGGTEAGA